MQKNKTVVKKRSKQTLKSNLFMLGMVWEISRSRVILTFLINLLDFGAWVFHTVVFMKYIFGAAENNHSFSDVSIFLGFSLLGMLLLNMFESWYRQRFCLINDQLLYKELNRCLFDKACNVDIECYEDSEFYNNYTKAASEIFNRAVSVVENISVVVSATLSSAYVIYTMFTIHPWVGFASMLPVITNLTMGRRARRITYERNMEMIPYERRHAYVNRVFYLPKYAKEIRLTNVFNILARIYDDAMQGIIKVAHRYWTSLSFLNALRTTICFPLLFEGTWLLGAYLAMVRESITVSDFAVVANAAVSTTWMVINLTNGMVATFENALYIENLRTFLNYSEKIPEDQPGVPVPGRIETLEMRNVSFRYKGAKEYALKNININVKKGDLVSVVGHNGSGKSTLVKLLMRLYDPTEGEILLNSTDIREYDLRQYRELIGSTFQDFQVFSMSVLDNVVMGNKTVGDYREAAHSAMECSGVWERIAGLPLGIESTLTREFDDNGVNLSGGETQKVAVARSFAKRSSILLLDEPSSALDPIAEYHMFRNLINLCRGHGNAQKISIFISHRLSSATMADKIYLMENGEIIEIGTHAELMSRDGAYANIFRKQAENYLMEVEGI